MKCWASILGMVLGIAGAGGNIRAEMLRCSKAIKDYWAKAE